MMDMKVYGWMVVWDGDSVIVSEVKRYGGMDIKRCI